MATKTYVPKSSAKSVTFRDGGELLKLSFHAETVAAFLREHKNERGWVNLAVTKRRQPSDRGDTHCVYLDEWKPTGQAAQQTAPTQTTQPDQGNDDVPF